MSYPAYREYKDSGVEWLGEVPIGWTISRLGFEGWVRARLGWKGLKAEEYVDDGYVFLSTPNIKGRNIDFDQVNYISKQRFDESPEISLRTGDVLLAKDGSTLGTVNIVRSLPRPTTVNSSIAVITPNNRLNGLFLRYLFDSKFMRSKIESIKGGMGVPHLFQADLVKFYLPLPPTEEQLTIATFLDHETARINALVEEQQRLIALLKEKRQAVISHAVTKGLEPDVPMKDSGVEWLGDVPEHWTVGKVKHLAVISGGYAFNSNEFSDSGIQLIRIGNLYQSKLQLDREPIYVPIASRGKYKPFEVKWGDLLMSLTGTLGKRDYGFAVMYDSVDPSLLNQRVAKITPFSEKVEPAFLLLLLQSESYLNQIYSLPSGTKQANLSNSDVLSPWIASPSCLQEQSAIVNRVSELTSRLDQLISKAGVAISLLQERRSALISAAVTGKIDVRGWQPPADSVVAAGEATQMEAV
ncbi:restriction endonuclease subunit S [Vreelandella populi]|uniref:Restriction endonuclease subunit S n=1 Tax=Vreelandella populi TaxID=2498858 RepID=A0A433L7X2_9GAMM|nr:restriction endonuclease subunit S [Halomonas populi]RUR43434.1 restriction endonuclease subunit S [Halomonas populi]